jgi:DNA-binding CsgD family transcriptional regulator
MRIGDLHELLVSRLHHVFPRPRLVQIAALSSGNAFYALEIGRELVHSGQQLDRGRLPIPVDIRELVATRVRRLPSRTRETLQAVAAASHPAARLIDWEYSTLQPAVDADIVRVTPDGRIEFSHPLYASAMYETAPDARRRELHRWLAGLLEAPDEHAHHLSLATLPPDNDVARALELGAAHARTRGAWHSAAVLLEQSRAFTPEDQSGDRLRRGISAAEHYAHAGDRQRAAYLLDHLLEQASDASDRARALCLLGQIRYNDESFAEALRLLEQARLSANDESLIANIELDLAYVASQLWDFERAATHAAQALDLTRDLGDDGLYAMALGYRAMSEYLCGRGIDWLSLEQAVALEDPRPVVPLQRTPSGIQGLLLLFDGQLNPARVCLTEVCQRAIDRGDESDVAFFQCWLAWLETQAGDLQAARARAEEALLNATLTGSNSMRAFALACRAVVEVLLGNIDEARRLCDETRTLAQQSTYAIALITNAVAGCLADMSVEDVAGVWRTAEPLLVRLADVSVTWEPGTLLFLPDALEALIALDALDAAEHLLDASLERARAVDRVWALATGERCRGLLLAARGDLVGASVQLESALVQHQRLDMPFEVARTQLCLGRVERRRKRRKAARMALTQALELFERLGTPLWAARARAELERTHLRQAPAGLSPGELRVAELAGQGLTNRQIARRLFISPKTVEANLGRAYAKLGVSSRAELGARMATQRA